VVGAGIDLRVQPVEEFESTTEWWTSQSPIIKRRTANQKQVNHDPDRTYELRRLIDS
jgi:hypothetical protein